MKSTANFSVNCKEFVINVVQQVEADDGSSILAILNDQQFEVRVPIFPPMKRPSYMKANLTDSVVDSGIQKQEYINQVYYSQVKDTSQMNHLLPSSAKKQQSFREDTLTISTKRSNISSIDSSNNYVVNNYLSQIKKHIGTPQRYEVEGTIIQKLISQTGKLIYMLHMEWASGYTNFLQHKNDKISGPINNNGIFSNQIDDQDDNYNSNLKQDQDFVLLNRNTWMFISSLYGGGPEVNYNDYVKEVRGILEFEGAQCNNSLTLTLSRVSSILSSNLPNESYISIQLPFDYTLFEKPPIGFHNESNYCFMHAGLQGLLSVEQLNCWMETEGKKIIQTSNIVDNQYKWISAYFELVEQISAKKAGSFLKINQLKNLIKINFDPKQQHDCQEFLRFLLEQLNQEMRLQDQQTITEILFQGQMLSQLNCQNKKCNNISSKFENFMDLSLSMHNLVTLDECLKHFFAQEILSDNYHCESCDTYTSAVKRFLIGSTPTILLIHFKRFNMVRQRVKLHGHVNFPLKLNMDEFSSQQFDNNYQLRSVVVHYGTPEKGHYVTFSLRQKNWYYFDDHKIYQVTEQDILQQQAYLLFYEKIEDLFSFSGN